TPHDRATFTAHNATVTHDLALVTWYAAGLQAVDVSDPSSPRIFAELRPDPLPSVAVGDPSLGGVPVGMWSYPVIRKGLIYAADVRNGLYILHYTGTYAREIDEIAFAEGNSSL